MTGKRNTISREARRLARAEKRSGDKRTGEVSAPVPFSPPKTPTRLTPRTERQRAAISMLKSGKSLVILGGFAGTGKSMIAAHHAAEQLASGRVKRIILNRPAVSLGKTNGAVPGTLEEKLAPYFTQTIEYLREFLGSGFTKYCLENKIIELCASEYMRGMSFSDAVVICEESQNYTLEQLTALVTRVGDNCQMILTGDETQRDISESGLPELTRIIGDAVRFPKEHIDAESQNHLENSIGVVFFLRSDVVRSGLCKALVLLLS